MGSFDLARRFSWSCLPHALWQFVLRPEGEEPLDLLELLIAEIRRAPPHVLDRLTASRPAGASAARRVLIRLGRRGAHTASWVKAAEDVLRAAFY